MSKQLNNLIIFILVIVILFSFSIKPYADFVLLGLGLKVLATILASMGLLTFIQTNMGVETFFDGLVQYGEQVKGLVAVKDMFVNVGINSILTNAKMKISSLGALIKEYYNTLRWEQEIDESIYADMPGTMSSVERENTGQVNPTFKSVIGEQILGNGYTFKTSISYQSGGAGLKAFVTAQVLLNGVVLSTHDKMLIYDDFLITAWSNNARYYIKAQLSDNVIRISSTLQNLTRNTTQSRLDDIVVSPIIGLAELPRYQIPEIGDIPIPLTVPLGLAMPWEMALVNQTAAIGLTLEGLYEMISSISLDSYIEKLAELPKSIIDSLPQTEVIVDTEGIITAINAIEIPDTLPDIKEQTGILGAILAFLTGLFALPSDIDIDLSPFKGLALTNKFPFSLPWDLKRSFELLVAPPAPPKFTVPFVTETIVLDLAQFNGWATITRSAFSLIFVASLIIGTRKFIGGA